MVHEYYFYRSSKHQHYCLYNKQTHAITAKEILGQLQNIDYTYEENIAEFYKETANINNHRSNGHS